MLYFFSGTDTAKARAKMRADIEHVAQSADVIRVTDAHTTEDVLAALQGGGMFGGQRVVVFQNVLQNDEMVLVLLDALEYMGKASEPYFIFEEKVDAATRKKIEKYAEKSERFDAPKGERDNSVFGLANALQRGDKKALWVGYMCELGKGSAPEMIHGILFWAAKQQFLKSNGPAKKKAEQRLIALTELPHEARRNGFDMEYALERFVLSVA